MRNRMIRVTDKVLVTFDGNDTRPYLEALRVDCAVRNLTLMTKDVYFEHLGDFLTYLQSQSITLENVSKRTVQEYILSTFI